MANVYEHRVTRGAIRLSRRWEPDGRSAPAWGGGGTRAGKEGPSTAGRIQAKFSPRSRRAMRYEFASLPWELLGRRPAMITLTYPAAWRDCAADARAVVRHREALKERWRRRYGPPAGVWIMEFQPRWRRAPAERHAPHIHLYVGLPNEMSSEEYLGLLRRLHRRRELEEEFGKYSGRAQVRAPTGEFSDWLLRSWWEIVGSGSRAHRYRGADITPAFWSEQVEATADRTKIADYFWRESGKWGQKTPPAGFGGLRFYGRWGGRQGFVPVEGIRGLDQWVFIELRRIYRHRIEAQMRAEANRQGRSVRRYRRSRGMDGLTWFVPNAPEVAGRLEAWAEELAVTKALKREKWEREQAEALAHFLATHEFVA